VLFRDAGCQFRALYSYDPETDVVVKLYGTGPTHVYDVMFDKFFKYAKFIYLKLKFNFNFKKSHFRYNSGGKCFAQVHTKHLTVTCDAFTIHNSLWQGKKATNLPSKKDMALVI
jgi:calmodulin-regulated spectrin-associated protein